MRKLAKDFQHSSSFKKDAFLSIEDVVNDIEKEQREPIEILKKSLILNFNKVKHRWMLMRNYQKFGKRMEW